MTPKWQQEELEILLNNNKLPDGQIVKLLKTAGYTRTIRAVKDKLYKLKGTGLHQTTKPINFSHEDEYSHQPQLEPQQTAEELWETIRTLRVPYQSHEACNITGVDLDILIPDGTGRPENRIIHMTDWHIPFERDDLIQKIIDTEADGDTSVVVGGDMIDCYAPSSFMKDKFIPLRKEYDIALEYLKLLSAKFKKVYMIMGNHEYRVNKIFMNQVNPAISFFLNKDILWHLSRGYRYDDEGNIVSHAHLPNVQYIGGHEPWYLILGKAVFCHPYFFKSGAGNTVRQAITYMSSRAEFDAMLIGHTHTCSKAVYNYKLAIETPCLASPLDYEKQPKMAYLPQTNGYSVVYLDKDGNVDYNSSGPIYLGSNYYKKYFI